MRAKDCSSGDVLADEQAQAARKEDVLGTLSQMTGRFRARLGESLATIEKHSRPFDEATTPSLEAWKAYTTAVNAFMSSNPLSAEALFKHAIAIDPDFAMAHASLGFHYSVRGESTLSRQSMLKAYQLRDRTSDVERFFITTLYDRDVTGNLDREQRTLETWAQTYPRDAVPHGLLSGLATGSTGKYELSIDEGGKAIVLDPDLAPAYASKARGELSLNRLGDAEATLRRAAERKLDAHPLFFLIRYFIAFLKGDGEDLKRRAALAKGRPQLEDMMAHVDALALARSGRLQDAKRTAAVAVDIARQSGQRERAALFQVATAVSESLYGRAAAAGQSATEALALARGREVDYAAAFAFAVAGDVPRSRALAEELERSFPEDTLVQFIYLPTLRGLLALNAAEPAAALQHLQAASRFDLALGGTGFNGFFGGLYPVYVRGEAYRAARRPAEAVAEFQKILDHRNIVLVDPMDALARLQLARALALSGDTVKAKRAYDDLFILWTNADTEIPAVQEAKAEYARLR